MSPDAFGQKSEILAAENFAFLRERWSIHGSALWPYVATIRGVRPEAHILPAPLEQAGCVLPSVAAVTAATDGSRASVGRG